MSTTKNLIDDLVDAVIGNTESIEVDNIGADAFYLVGAISHNSYCEWNANRPIAKILKDHLPANHPIHSYVKVIQPRKLKCGHNTYDETDDCQHSKHEDHLVCTCCGRCNESLDSNDLCVDCGGKVEE
jgi:hypothetical protein